MKNCLVQNLYGFNSYTIFQRQNSWSYTKNFFSMEKNNFVSIKKANKTEGIKLTRK